MSTASADSAALWRLVLTPHPLQRVGAHALAALGEVASPEHLDAEGLQKAMNALASDAARAALKDSKEADGFWQKASLSFFPNSPMNHPGRRKGKNAQGHPRTDRDVKAAVRAWLSPPEPDTWPGVGCMLCGRTAVGFFGKRDVVLAESEAYRNTTPPGHEGLALCWPCLCSFYALPYGSQLTGGVSVALHTWDEGLLRQATRRRVEGNRRVAQVGSLKAAPMEARKVVALTALRFYGDRLTDSVELLVFNNNNRGQLLESHALSQPLAEWLRRTRRETGLRQGFAALVRAHRTPQAAGVAGLARNAFDSPTRIVTAGLARMTACALRPQPDHVEIRELSRVLASFATEVMQVKEKDLAEIRGTAQKVASLLAKEKTLGPLKTLKAKLRDSRQLRSWLIIRAIAWAGTEHEGFSGPLISERGMLLLFDPGSDTPSWLYRDLLLVGVLEELARLGWKTEETAEESDETVQQLDAEDEMYLSQDDEEEDEQ